MEFNQYQAEAFKTAVYPNIGKNITYPTLGLCGEAGEVAEKVKKVIRDHNGILSQEQKEKIILELGDVLWYIALICYEMHIPMEFIVHANLIKLANRKDKNTLHGSGDNR